MSGTGSSHRAGRLSDGGRRVLLYRVYALLPAQEVFKWATRNAAEAFGIDAGGIAKGKLADAILVDLSKACMQPCHNHISNFVYSADAPVISYVICDGKVIYP